MEAMTLEPTSDVLEARRRQQEAYNKLIASGKLTERQVEVYSAMYKHKNIYPNGMTAFEINIWMSNVSPKHSDVHRKLRELERMELVKQDGKILCTRTGKNVNRWLLT